MLVVGYGDTVILLGKWIILSSHKIGVWFRLIRLKRNGLTIASYRLSWGLSVVRFWRVNKSTRRWVSHRQWLIHKPCRRSMLWRRCPIFRRWWPLLWRRSYRVTHCLSISVKSLRSLHVVNISRRSQNMWVHNLLHSVLKLLLWPPWGRYLNIVFINSFDRALRRDKISCMFALFLLFNRFFLRRLKFLNFIQKSLSFLSRVIKSLWIFSVYQITNRINFSCDVLINVLKVLH